MRHELPKGALIFGRAPGVGAPAMALAQGSGLAEVIATKFRRQPVDPADSDGCQAGEDSGEVSGETDGDGHGEVDCEVGGEVDGEDDGELGWQVLRPVRRAGGTYFHFADGDDGARERGGEGW